MGGAKLSDVYSETSPGCLARDAFRLVRDLEGVKRAAIFDPKLLEVEVVFSDFSDCCEVETYGLRKIIWLAVNEIQLRATTGTVLRLKGPSTHTIRDPITAPVLMYTSKSKKKEVAY